MAKALVNRSAQIKNPAILFGLFVLLTYVFAILGASLIEIPAFIPDWEMFWRVTHNLTINYEQLPVFNPPWVLALLWPMTIWSLPVSWALLAIFTLVSFALNIRHQTSLPKWTAAFLLLSVSYPSLRQLADGNLEFLVILGALLLLWAFDKESTWAMAGGLILLSSKVQETWLLILLALLWVLRKWPREKIGMTVIILVAYGAPFLIWKGQPWISSLSRFPYGSPFNSSLWATLVRFEFPGWLGFVFWAIVLIWTLWAVRKSLKRPGLLDMALLVAASMLLSPYSGNTVLVPFVLGVGQLFRRPLFPGTFLVILYNLPFIFLTQVSFRGRWEYTYWTGVLLLTWIILIWIVGTDRFAGVSTGKRAEESQTKVG